MNVRKGHFEVVSDQPSSSLTALIFEKKNVDIVQKGGGKVLEMIFSPRLAV